MHSNDQFLEVLGERIRKIRTEKKINQQSLAAMCDFEKSNMNRIEKGNTNPTILTLSKISKALGVSIAYLVDHDNALISSAHAMLAALPEVGAKIRKLRESKGLTITELAQKCTCTEAEITEIEEGKHDAAITTLKKIALVLCISLPELFT